MSTELRKSSDTIRIGRPRGFECRGLKRSHSPDTFPSVLERELQRRVLPRNKRIEGLELRVLRIWYGAGVDIAPNSSVEIRP